MSSIVMMCISLFACLLLIHLVCPHPLQGKPDYAPPQFLTDALVEAAKSAEER